MSHTHDPLADGDPAHSHHGQGTRRDFLYYVTGGAGAVAAGAAGWTLVNQMNPSADVTAMSSIDVDVSAVEVGTQLTVKWLYPPTQKAGRKMVKLDQPFLYKDTKPDTDNLIKLLKDVLTDLSFWRDDAQVASEISEKFWVAGNTGLYIKIERL